MKDEEQKQLGWNAKRELSKINYRIHTDAIKRRSLAGVPKVIEKYGKDAYEFRENSICGL